MAPLPVQSLQHHTRRKIQPDGKDPDVYRSSAYTTSTSAKNGDDTVQGVKVTNGSLRKRLIGRFNRKRSVSFSEPTCEEVEEKQPSRLRKSISSISLSLRGRHAAVPSSLDVEARSQRASAIRRSVDSISSSIRRKYNSLGSRSYKGGQRRPAAIPSQWLPAMFRGSSSHPRRRGSLLYLSKTSSTGYDSNPPQLPGLDEIIARTSTEGKPSNGDKTGPNSCSMSIFDALDGSIEKNWHGSLPIRLKHPDRSIPNQHDEVKDIYLCHGLRYPEPQEWGIYNAAEVDKKRDVSDTCSQHKADLNDSGKTSKLPVEWVDHVLDTSHGTRNPVTRLRLHTSDPEVWRKIFLLRLSRAMQSAQPDAEMLGCFYEYLLMARDSLPEVFDTLEALTRSIKSRPDVDEEGKDEFVKTVPDVKARGLPPSMEVVDRIYRELRSEIYALENKMRDSESSVDDLIKTRRRTDEDSLVTETSSTLTNDDEENAGDSLPKDEDGMGIVLWTIRADELV
ncbi:hypothetical protein F4779DRAFT_315285 [Xylariaceae sp. FL0662B]|nr:hypothetical protein F4779DRAFT_315285 [Xylariaceae sp. FL0662B]